MIKFIKKILSNKINVVIIGIFLLAVMVAAGFTVIAIQRNVQQMADIGDEINYFPPYPKVNYSGKSPELVQLIQRGEYLTKAGDCIACHTNSLEKGPTFAGGLPMETPFGTIYSPNITPDKATGLGNWTDQQFITAMREGIAPDGSHYYPAFPYLYFNKVTTADLLAIKAYLNHIPAIHRVNLKNQMVWPFNWRFLQNGWRLLFFTPVKTGPFIPDPEKTPQWNRGAYLVEGLGHCAMCHTPSYFVISEKFALGAPIRQYNLTGSKIQGYLAPNISKANLDSISEEELIQVFTHNRLIGGGTVEGPMLEANQNSLKYLSHSDLLAIANYLKSVQSKAPPKPKPGKGGIGKAIYDSYCIGCHATGAGGAPKYNDASTWTATLKKGMEQVYANAIKGIDGMPAKGTCYSCNDADIKQAVDYMLASIAGKDTHAIPPPKKLSIADGEQIYNESCSVCHNTGFKNAPRPGDLPAWDSIVTAGFETTYLNVMTGRKGHSLRGGCMHCSDAELKAAVKYMLTVSSDKDYTLW